MNNKITEDDLIFGDEKFDENEIIPDEEEWNDWNPNAIKEVVEQVGITLMPLFNMKDINKWAIN
jgi:hypothetical protein